MGSCTFQEYAEMHLILDEACGNGAAVTEVTSAQATGLITFLISLALIECQQATLINTFTVF
jgi:hypothetical protein